MMSGTNNGQTLSGMIEPYKNLIAGMIMYIAVRYVAKYIKIIQYL